MQILHTKRKEDLFSLNYNIDERMIMMNCFDETELVINYIENNILEVNYSEISRLVGIPTGLYQRIFSYVCGISIADYIKRRRLTLAAFELQQGQEKVIDIAIKYGYDSHASFTRAFKEQTGILPSHVKDKGDTPKLYPRFSFQNNDETYYMVKGKRIMADLVRIEYGKQSARKLVGVRRRVSFSEAGAFWKDYFTSGTSEKIDSLNENVCTDIDDYVALGYMYNFDETGNIFDYIIGKYVSLDTPVPESLISMEIPEGMISKSRIQGEFNDILNNAYFLITEGIKKNGYAVDYSNFYWCDVYTYERYCEPINRGEKVLILDYFMPVKTLI